MVPRVAKEDLAARTPNTRGDFRRRTRLSGKVHKRKEFIFDTVLKSALWFRQIWVRLVDGLCSCKINNERVCQEVQDLSNPTAK